MEVVTKVAGWAKGGTPLSKKGRGPLWGKVASPKGGSLRKRLERQAKGRTTFFEKKEESWRKPLSKTEGHLSEKKMAPNRG